MAYEPRRTEPDINNPLWVMVEAGGYNICIPGRYASGVSAYPSVLPNCTGYVHGRTMEIAGVTSDDLGLPNSNAVEYFDYATSDWERTQVPTLGAVAVYYSVPPYGNYQPGHVAIVEEIIDNDTVVMSESNYQGNRFDVVTCYRGTEWRPSTGWGVVFRGFLKNPYAEGRPTPGGGDASRIVTLAKLSKRRKIITGRRVII